MWFDLLQVLTADKKLRVYTFLTGVWTGWKYSTGFVSDEMIKAHLPPPGDDTIILMCGPPPMITFACNPSLDKLQYPAKSRFTY